LIVICSSWDMDVWFRCKLLGAAPIAGEDTSSDVYVTTLNSQFASVL
jgi:hypothetical protein